MVVERPCGKGPETSGRNGPLTEKDGKVSARPVTRHSETAVKGEKERRVSPRIQGADRCHQMLVCQFVYRICISFKTSIKRFVLCLVNFLSYFIDMVSKDPA